MALRLGHAIVHRLQFAGSAKFTATIDPASLAAGTSSDHTVTATGVKAGSAVLAAPPAALPAGLQFSAFVSGANQITLRLSNVSAGAVDAPSGAWTFFPIGV